MCASWLSTTNGWAWFLPGLRTHLFSRLKREGNYAIPVGLFNDSNEWMLAEQIFIDQKPAFYSFKQKTGDLVGEEVFAQYSEK